LKGFKGLKETGMQEAPEATESQGSAAAESMKRYLDAHLGERVTAKSLANAVGYSPYHAARVFKRHFGQTPFEYLREQRLISSAFTLRAAKVKVIDVALDYVFDSHEGFTRAFSKAFGIAPKRFATVAEPSGWLIPFGILPRPNNRQEEAPMSEHQQTAIIFTQIIERPARKLLLLRSKTATDYFEYCEELGCSENEQSPAWETLCNIKEALYEPAGLWLPNNMRPAGTGLYAHGVELPWNYAGDIPEGYDCIELPACKLLVFQGEPFDEAQFGEAISALWERIAIFNPEVYGYEYADELAPRMQLIPEGWRGYIEMRPVREKVR